MKTLKIIFFLLPLSFLIYAQDGNIFFPEKDLIQTGIYYYPEHWAESQWERDIMAISDMGFEFVHLAEFAWFKMEPDEGRYDFAWLDKVVGLCEKYKLKILLCTPSAATPAWMRYAYPETFVMDGRYIRAEHGTRGLGSIVNSKYRDFVSGIVSEMAQRYGKNNNVVGWQLDNEPDAKPDYSPSSQDAFRQWLKNKYHTVETLNTSWGCGFWSQSYNNFDQITIPNTTIVGWWGNNPHALLDFKRYSADAQALFLDMQAGILRKYISPNQYITTNYTAVCQGADPRRTKNLDFATYTAYPNGGSNNLGKDGFRLGNNKTILFAADYFKNITGYTGVMELQPGPVNWGSYNPLLFPGTVRLWLYHAFAAGGKLACSYRFRQILYSAEQYHSGIIQTDGVTLSPGGEDYVQFMKEIKELRKNYTPNSIMPLKIASRSTAILWNHENFWSTDRQPQTYQWDSWGYSAKFMEIAKSFGALVDIISETVSLSKYKMVIVPAYELADSVLVNKWSEYAIGGGNLVVTCRTATKNRDGHFWEEAIAAPISGLIGAHIVASDMLSNNANGEISYNSKLYSWNNWADLLQPDKDTKVLATFHNQFYAGKAAVVKRSLGKGTVTYIGVNTDNSELEKDIEKELFQQMGVSVENYPEGVYVYWRDGFFIGVNYSSDSYSMNLPKGATVLIGEPIIKPAGVLVWKE